MLCSKRARLAAIISVLVLTAFHSLDAGAMSCEFDSDCNDGLACTLDLCNGGTCEWIADSGVCQNGFYCDGFEVCDPENAEADARGCIEGTPIDCSAGLPDCVESECSEAQMGACIDTPNDSLCDDGKACNGSESCDPVEGCLDGTPACVDGWACTTDNCTELGSGNYDCSFIPDNSVCADS